MDRSRFEQLNCILDKEIAIAKTRSLSFTDSRNMFLADMHQQRSASKEQSQHQRLSADRSQFLHDMRSQIYQSMPSQQQHSTYPLARSINYTNNSTAGVAAAATAVTQPMPMGATVPVTDVSNSSSYNFYNSFKYSDNLLENSLINYQRQHQQSQPQQQQHALQQQQLQYPWILQQSASDQSTFVSNSSQIYQQPPGRSAESEKISQHRYQQAVHSDHNMPFSTQQRQKNAGDMPEEIPSSFRREFQTLQQKILALEEKLKETTAVAAQQQKQQQMSSNRSSTQHQSLQQLHQYQHQSHQQPQSNGLRLEQLMSTSEDDNNPKRKRSSPRFQNYSSTKSSGKKSELSEQGSVLKPRMVSRINEEETEETNEEDSSTYSQEKHIRFAPPTGTVGITSPTSGVRLNSTTTKRQRRNVSLPSRSNNRANSSGSYTVGTPSGSGDSVRPLVSVAMRSNSKGGDNDTLLYVEEIKMLERELAMWQVKQQRQHVQLLSVSEANRRDLNKLKKLKKSVKTHEKERKQQEGHAKAYEQLFAHFEKSEAVREKQKTLIQCFKEELKALTKKKPSGNVYA